MNKAALDAVVALGIAAAIFTAGWLVKGWKDDAAALDAERAHAKAYAARIDRFDTQAANTLTALQDQKAGQTIIRKEVIREVEKYRDRPCFEPDLVRLLNLSATGSDPSGADGAVSGDASAAP